ncbi:universal stress protein A [Alsobacter metallidurans]|uniref:Universal stress protein A n=1 Tax=Alsobacter metallidurans TaxID=340221 RepID=A0A917I6J3_9HYPH|nr:universal stress protein [Alsobacter metallidurans]GGH19670.1 universal stress protein A [Alsobacter metallidurans]
MAFKDILVELAAGRGGDATRAFALGLGASTQAHVTGVAPIGDMDAGYLLAEAGAVMLSRSLAESTERANALRSSFEADAAAAGVRAESLNLKLSAQHGDRVAAQLARHFDMTIVSQPQDDKAPDEPSILEAALFGSGRPVLIVPYIHRDPPRLDRAVLAWDGSREATLALAGALPLLVRAAKVEIVTINRDRHVDFPGFNIARHLARHGVNAELKRVTTELDVGNALLSHAVDTRADLLVMGGYAHSRFRELVFGGATRTVLESMTLPVVMAH